jgi:hypothetical protein
MKDKQTAVEWLVNQIAGKPTHYIIGTDDLEEIKENRYNLLFNLDIDITPLVEQAKQMEKEQIIDARDSYINQMLKVNNDLLIYGEAQYKEMTSEQYYNETYGK